MMKKRVESPVLCGGVVMVVGTKNDGSDEREGCWGRRMDGETF